MESFLSVEGESKRETVIERSRFITTVASVESEEAAREFVDRIRRTYPDATHNCYAYVSSADGNLARYSDDGEPQGTAGLPMLEAIKGRSLKLTAAVVTRYFGGIKLGAGGLVRAYSGAVLGALDEAKIVRNVWSAELFISLSYELYPVFLKLAAEKSVEILGTNFDNNVSITCVLPRVSENDFAAALKDRTLGKGDVEKRSEYYYRYGKL